MVATSPEGEGVRRRAAYLNVERPLSALETSNVDDCNGSKVTARLTSQRPFMRRTVAVVPGNVRCAFGSRHSGSE